MDPTPSGVEVVISKALGVTYQLHLSGKLPLHPSESHCLPSYALQPRGLKGLTAQVAVKD